MSRSEIDLTIRPHSQVVKINLLQKKSYDFKIITHYDLAALYYLKKYLFIHIHARRNLKKFMKPRMCTPNGCS